MFERYELLLKVESETLWLETLELRKRHRSLMHAYCQGLKYSESFTKLAPSLFTVVTLALSMYLLAVATSKLPIGTDYGVWVGIGALGTGILAIILLEEAATPARIFFLVLLLISIIGLKLSTKS